MRNTILILACAIMSLLSCSKNDQERDDAPYFQFIESDSSRLLSYEANQEIIFRNEEGEERIFKVDPISSEYKTGQVVGATFSGGGSILYYYDQMEINMINSNFQLAYHPIIQLFRRPQPGQNVNADNIHDIETKFSGLIRFFPFWNGDPNILIDFGGPKIEMIINNITYENVHVLNSNNLEILNNNKNVNIIYYDSSQGLLGFDDLAGKRWRLVN